MEKNKSSTNTAKMKFLEFRFENNVNENGSDRNVSFGDQLLKN